MDNSQNYINEILSQDIFYEPNLSDPGEKLLQEINRTDLSEAKKWSMLTKRFEIDELTPVDYVILRDRIKLVEMLKKQINGYTLE